MVLTPRLLVVDSVSTIFDEKMQNVGLTLLSREASAEFYEQFPDGIESNVAEVLSYAKENASNLIGNSEIFDNGGLHNVKGTYSIGDIITEKEAYDIGHVIPHIDTVVGQIVQTYLNSSVKGSIDFATGLINEKLIDESQSANYNVLKNTITQIDVFSNDISKEFMCGPKKISDQLSVSHPIILEVYRPLNDGLMPVGIKWLVPEMNTVYDFMTYVPAE